MNQVNPLHIGALLVALLAFLLFTLNGVKQEFTEEKSLYQESEKLAVELTALKESYGNAKKTENSLERLLSQGSLKSAGLLIKKEKRSIIISTKSIDAQALNSLMSKLLNGSYNITQMQIKRLSDTKASLELEIKW